MGLVLGGCVLPSVELDGKACPCEPGWTCDASTQTCRAAVDSADPESDATSGEPGTGAPQTPRFDILSFSADWSTPESIHWTWEVEGADEDFHAWALWLATDEAALDDEAEVLVFDGRSNPELDRFVLKNTQGIDPVVATLTRGLRPNTPYFARLFVFDTAGDRWQSPNVAVRSTTLQPNAERVLFDEEPLNGGAYPNPVCFQRTDAAPLAGSHHYSLALRCDSDGDQTCEAGDPDVAECWENLRLENLGIGLDDLGGGDFTDAFLEFHLAIDTDDPEGHGWWSSAGLAIDETIFGVAPLTFPADGTYHRFQIPLTQMGITLDAIADPIHSVRIGSQWQYGTTLRLDAVRVRW